MDSDDSKTMVVATIAHRKEPRQAFFLLKTISQSLILFSSNIHRHLGIIRNLRIFCCTRGSQVLIYWNHAEKQALLNYTRDG